MFSCAITSLCLFVIVTCLIFALRHVGRKKDIDICLPLALLERVMWYGSI